MISRLRLIPVLVFLLSFPSLLHAQWPVLYTASGSINCVKVLDQEGNSNIILIGMDAEIMLSTDGGTTFNTTKHPPFTGTVTDFSFMDADTGWASVLNNGTMAGLLKTTDGGADWVDVTTAEHDGNAVFYNKLNGRLFFSSEADSAEYSLDQGLTWTKFAPAGMTGYSFSGNIGLLATNPVVSGIGALRTTDGGVTWLRTTLRAEGWQPLVVPASNLMYYADPNTSESAMYVSRDGGLNWGAVTGYTNANSGTVRGDLCSMYNTATAMVMESLDEGKTWQPMMQSPTANTYTRFYLTSSTIYAFDQKKLYTHARGTTLLGADPIHILPPMYVSYQAAGCNPVDTVIRLYSCSCTTMQLVGDSIHLISPRSAFSVRPGPTPRPLCAADSIVIRYQPSSSLPDTADIHVLLQNGTTTIDTVIRVIGPGLPISVTASARNFNIRTTGCQATDTTLYLTNTLCNTLTLTSVSVDNTTHVQANLPFGLPRTIGPNETIAIPIHAMAIAAGTYNYVLTYVVTSPAGQTVTKDVGVNLLVAKTPSPDIHSFNWTAADLCALHDTAVYYINTLCDTIRINGINLQNSTDFKIPNYTFPIRLAPGDYIRIPVSILPASAGTYSTKLNIYAYIEDVAIDSAVPIMLKISKSLVPQATVTPNGAVFGAVSTCDSTRQMTLVFRNTECIPITVSNLVVSVPSDSTYTFPYHFAKGITLQPGTSDSIIVHFWPKINGGSGSIQVTYTYKDQTKLMTYAVSGFGSDKVTAALGTTTLDFDSLRFCDTKDLTTTIQNGPCADIVISSINVLSGNGFTVTSPKQGDVITVGATKDVAVSFTPTASGDVTGSVEIQITDKSGQVGVSDTINFVAHVKAPVRNVVMGSIASDPLLACKTRDTVITLTNKGECDVIKITGVNSSDPKVTVTNAAALTGISIPVDSSVQIQIHIDPANIATNIVGAITVQAAPDIQIPFNIPVSACQTTQTVVTMDIPDSNFATANCTSTTKTYTISINQDQSSFDVVTLESSNTKFGQLQIVGGGSAPYTVTPSNPLKVQITYDADATGSDTVWLHIRSTDGKIDRRIMLVGKTTGAAQSARLGIAAAAGGATITTPAAPAKPIDLSLIMRDAVDPTLGMQSARFHVQYNKSVLTKVKVTAAPGWSLVNDGGSEGDLDLKFSYSGGAIPAGQQVATLSVFPALSTVTTTGVTVAQTHFNDTDPNFERCKLALNNAGDVVTVNVTMTCGDSVIQRALLGQPIVGELSIIPNPTGHQSATTIAYATYSDADVKVEVMNLAGQIVAESADHLRAGDHSVTLPANSLRSGTYIVRVTANGIPKVGRFAVE